MAAITIRALSIAVGCAIAAGQGVDTQVKPVIGILSVPLDSTTEPCITSAEEDRARFGLDASCFTSFYVKFVESAGGRPVVIPYNANQSTLDALFSSVNGVLFTGGGADLYLNQTYVQTAKYLFDKVVDSAKGPNPVPLHGTCMGFQTISIVAAMNDSVLARASDGQGFDSEDISWPIFLTSDGEASRMIKAAPSYVRDTLVNRNSTVSCEACEPR